MLRKILYAVLAVAVFSAVVFIYLKKRSYDEDITRLQNLIADQQHTIEVKDGQYLRKAQELEKISLLLDQASKREQELLAEIQRNKEEILALTQAVVYWKKAYEGAVAASQTEEPGPPLSEACVPECAKLRTRVDFNKDFGVMLVTGHTVTNPPEGYVKVEQVRPLTITVTITQSKDGSWNVRGTTDDENIGIDFKVAAVNPAILERKWYEDIYVSNQLGISSGGFTDTVGVGLRIGSFAVGPTYTYTHVDRSESFYGGSVTWFPFAK